MGLSELGKLLWLFAGFVALLALLVSLAGKLSFLGRLPGDLTFRRGNVSCYVPIVSSILLSLLLTVALNVLIRLLRK